MGKRKKKQQSRKIKHDLVRLSRVNPWDLFVTEEDRLGQDVLSMTDFLSEASSRDLGTQDSEIKQGMLGTLSEQLSNFAIVGDIGYSLNNSTLVADMSSLGQEILKGLNDGTYEFLESKGEKLASIVKVGERGIITQVRLKEIIDPRNIISNLHLLAFRAALGRVSDQIASVSWKIGLIHDEQRSRNFYHPFFEARTLILSAADETPNKQRKFLQHSLNLLMPLVDSLMRDANDKLQKLSKVITEGQSKEKLDELIGYIEEDLSLIVRYIGLYCFVSNYLKKENATLQMLDKYRKFFEDLTHARIYYGERTAFELLHSYGQYAPAALDYWLNEPPKILRRLEALIALESDIIKRVYKIELSEGE